MTTLSNSSSFIPDWPAPSRVGSLITTRNGGVSQGAFSSFNLGRHVGDDPQAVAANRQQVRDLLAADPIWLEQIHGIQVINAAECSANGTAPQADAAFTRQSRTVCVVMTADCLPVLFCDDAGTVVAAAHAGWRGLLAGILEETIRAMNVPGRQLMAYLGPAIGPQSFEVGDEVRAAYVSADLKSAEAFKPSVPGKWLADIYLLARQRLNEQGVERIFGGQFCTVRQADRFFSYRRDGQTGRMASMIWLENT